MIVLGRHVFIVQEYRTDGHGMQYVTAPPGWRRTPDGVVPDRAFPKGGAEWTDKPELAYEFISHRAAARVANKCGPNVEIRMITKEQE